MIGHKVFILSYNCSMSVLKLRILLEGFSVRPAFFPNCFYIEKSGSFHGLIKKKKLACRLFTIYSAMFLWFNKGKGEDISTLLF